MLKCKICNHEGKQLHQHIVKRHNMSVTEYKIKFGDCKMQLVSEETLKVKKQVSHFKVEYWLERGYTESQAKHEISELQKRNNSKRTYEKHQLILCNEYWMTKHGLTEQEAIDKIKKIQETRSSKSSKFLGKHHTDDSKKRISESISMHIKQIGVNNWIQHFGDQTIVGISKIEISCYNELKTLFPELQSNIPIGPYIVDMLYKNKIIEFNGCFWHADPKRFNEFDQLQFPSGLTIAGEVWKRDKIRNDYLKRLNYDVFIIWEDTWKTKKSQILDQIHKFINI